MRTHFHNEMAELQEEVRKLGRNVLQNLTATIESLRETDHAKAVQVMRNDRTIDLHEVRNEEHCLKIIALHQPVADDLRYIMVLHKVNHELERISDLAVEIAANTLTAQNPDTTGKRNDVLTDLTVEVASRLERVLDALFAKDTEVARQIWMGDAEINRQSRELSREIQTTIPRADEKTQPELFARLENTRHLERMADHVKNIAKDIIYLVVGEIVRHRGAELRKSTNRRIKVLFVCVHNSARSQIAEACLKQLYPDKFEVQSAGLETGELNPLAVKVMKETGIDISNNRTKDVFSMLRNGDKFDYLITVCDPASAERCPPSFGMRGELNWAFEDPKEFQGTDEQKMDAARKLRDAICVKIKEWASQAVLHE